MLKKATLTFDMTEETDPYLCAMKGLDLRFAIQEILIDTFRSRIKYGLKHGEAGLSTEDLLEKMRAEVYEILRSHQVLDLLD